MWGPVGRQLELPHCKYGYEGYELPKRLVEGVKGVNTAQKAIQVRVASIKSSRVTVGEGEGSGPL